MLNTKHKQTTINTTYETGPNDRKQIVGTGNRNKTDLRINSQKAWTINTVGSETCYAGFWDVRRS